jgi:hypothetical protein
LSTVVANPQVAFEVDGWDSAAGTAWSVVIKGQARRVNRTDDLIDSVSLPLYPWHGGRKECIVRIVAEQITGRAFDRVDPAAWRSPLAGAPHTVPE